MVPSDTRGWAGSGVGGPSGGSPSAGVTRYIGSSSPGGCQGAHSVQVTDNLAEQKIVYTLMLYL